VSSVSDPFHGSFFGRHSFVCFKHKWHLNVNDVVGYETLDNRCCAQVKMDDLIGILAAQNNPKYSFQMMMMMMMM